MKANDQPKLFEVDESWKEHWKDMPEFVQEDLTPWKSLTEGKAELISLSKKIYILVFLNVTFTPIAIP